MAKRYDPIMCMMVDEPTKAQDAMPSDLKKAGYEVGTVEKYGSTYYTLVYNGKVISTSPTEANIVEKAKKHYANRHGKAQDAEFQMYGPEFHHPIIKASSKEEAIKKAKEIYGWGGKVEAVKVSDSASTLDKAIRMCDEQIRLVKTISKKNGYAIHIVEGGYGERIVLTFPNESYANPHMWLGSNNSSNIQKAKELLNEFSK